MDCLVSLLDVLTPTCDLLGAYAAPARGRCGPYAIIAFRALCHKLELFRALKPFPQRLDFRCAIEQSAERSDHLTDLVGLRAAVFFKPHVIVDDRSEGGA